MNLLSRRTFLKNSFLSSVIFVTFSGELFGAVTPMATLSALHEDLFPNHADTPFTDSVNSIFYLRTVILKHTCIEDDTKSFIRDGVKWLNEESVSKYKKVYTKLSSKQRQKVLKEIVDTDWGESWMGTIMVYLLEAMLGDPIYGINSDKSGWKWLNHQPGYPRPKKALL